ncbi:MAG: hypothetical protein JSS38_01900 [Nitrospira sp.]|nr:hypothetical protein [Nitrospira sp.]
MYARYDLPGPAIDIRHNEHPGVLHILITFAFNVVVRYPGNVFQPYASVGGGAFYFNSSGTIRGHQVVPDLNAFGGMKVSILDDVGMFVEGKFNRATITNFDGVFGLSGEYRAFTP